LIGGDSSRAVIGARARAPAECIICNWCAGIAIIYCPRLSVSFFPFRHKPNDKRRYRAHAGRAVIVSVIVASAIAAMHVSPDYTECWRKEEERRSRTEIRRWDVVAGIRYRERARLSQRD
jgi:hypothetical protein